MKIEVDSKIVELENKLKKQFTTQQRQREIKMQDDALSN
jgi:hypothetical protein